MSGQVCCRWDATRDPVIIVPTPYGVAIFRYREFILRLLWHQMIKKPEIKAEYIEHRLHSLICLRCIISACSDLHQGVEGNNYGPSLRTLRGVLFSAFPLTIAKTSKQLDRRLVLSIIGGVIVLNSLRLAACLREPVKVSLREGRLQHVVHMVETDAAISNTDG